MADSYFHSYPSEEYRKVYGLSFPNSKKKVCNGYNLLKEEFDRVHRIQNSIDAFCSSRFNLCNLFSWAVPNDDAILALMDIGRIVEVGAGRGYWAALASAYGVDIVCYDKTPPDDTFYNVQEGDETSILHHQDRALMLCWPPYQGDFALNALLAYEGDTLIFIGEGNGGCTGTDEFHQLIESEWAQVQRVILPSWMSIHDNMYIYRRDTTP